MADLNLRRMKARGFHKHRFGGAEAPTPESSLCSPLGDAALSSGCELPDALSAPRNAATGGTKNASSTGLSRLNTRASSKPPP
jgi:hypothetical protein